MDPSTKVTIFCGWLVMVQSPSMRHQVIHRAQLVMRGKAVSDGLGGFVHADELDLGPVAAEL